MKRSFLSLVVVTFVSLQTIAQAPRTISHQGRLTDNLGQVLKDSTWSMKFTLYNRGGETVWTQTSGVATDESQERDAEVSPGPAVEDQHGSR